MATLPLRDRAPVSVYAIADVSSLQLVPQVSHALTLVSQASPAGTPLDHILRASAVVSARATIARQQERLRIAIGTGLALATGIAASALGSSTGTTACLGIAAFAGVEVAMWGADLFHRARALRRLGPAPESDDNASSTMKAMVIEAERRYACMLDRNYYGWLGSRLPIELERRVRVTFEALFEERGFTPRVNQSDKMDSLVWVLETCAADERPELTAFITEHLGASAVAEHGLDGLHATMLREALAGRAYRFTSTELGSEQRKVVDDSIAIIDSMLYRPPIHDPRRPPAGCAVVATLELAQSIAAHFQTLGLRVGLGRVASPAGAIKVTVAGANDNPAFYAHLTPTLYANAPRKPQQRPPQPLPNPG